MYPMPEQPELKPARLRPLPDARPPAAVPLAAPLPADGPYAAPLAGDVLPVQAGWAAAEPSGPVLAGPPAGTDRQRDHIRDDMNALADRATAASSWLESSRHYAQLLNQTGVVPVTARFATGDLAFLAEAREKMLDFAELTTRLVDLHQPLDAGGITTDPSSPIRRCRSCMWRWPCPTFSIVAEVVDGSPAG